MRAVLIILFACGVICGCNDDIKPKQGNLKEKNLKKEETKKPVDESVFDSLSSTLILKKLFDEPEIDSSGMAVWKPNYYERQSFPVSYDGKCHTAIDTIMYFTDRNEAKSAAVIFTTYNYQWDNDALHIAGAHFEGIPIGIALFSETKEKKWRLYKFEKAFTSLGYFGNYRSGREDAGKISLKKMGDKWTCLSLIQGIGGNMGEFSGYESLYSIEEYQLHGFPNNVLSEILSYNYYYSYESIDGKTKKTENCKLIFLKRKDDYYDIELRKISNGKVETTIYRYSDEYNAYLAKEENEKNNGEPKTSYK